MQALISRVSRSYLQGKSVPDKGTVMKMRLEECVRGGAPGSGVREQQELGEEEEQQRKLS